MSTLTLQPDATDGVDTPLWQGRSTTNLGTLSDERAGHSGALSSIGSGLLNSDLSSVTSPRYPLLHRGGREHDVLFVSTELASGTSMEPMSVASRSLVVFAQPAVPELLPVL
jgi:hypothetical protein